ncbi:hypothetical protein OJ996_09130 [Luteolibacter sp. GHJ8]|uniref:Phage tail protein n=1 Tax=Luteolibacter rhizosphaerae TaxID=2989719 RepID=A0ABT3G1M8_9BACT|nr:hypothetical protein [Luteolibacter rhizosphaerae]MCW1913736.1 hypothetical protein [Luteolibacter rhizosphaerae]
MKDIILGPHLLFARDGDEIDGVTVSAEAKPDTTPSSNYTKVASCEGWEPRRSVERITRRAPNPGRYGDRKTILTNKQMEYAFDLQEWSEMTLAELLLGGEKPVAGVFVPNASEEDLRGWWIVQGYDQEDNLIVALNVWGEARVEQYKFGETLNPYALIVKQLNSTLNTGEVSNLS